MNPFGSSDDDDEEVTAVPKGHASSVGQQQRQHREANVNQVNGGTGSRGRRSPLIEYPGDLNPFGDDDEEERTAARDGRDSSRDASRRNRKKEVSSRIDDERINSSQRSDAYNQSLNPFGSDEDEQNDSSITTTSTTEPSSLASGSGTPVPRPRTSLHPVINSNPASRESTPVSFRRSIGSNVSRSSLDSRSRKVIKPSIPPPPAPSSPSLDSDAAGSRSPLRPHRSPKKAPPPARPRQPFPNTASPITATGGTGDKSIFVSRASDPSPSQSMVTVPDSQSNERTADPHESPDPTTPVTAAATASGTLHAVIINPDPSLTVNEEEDGKEVEAESLSSQDPQPTRGETSTNCQVPVPAKRRISLTPSARSEATISSISVDSDQSHNSSSGCSNKKRNDSGNCISGSSSNRLQEDLNDAAGDHVVSLSQQSTSSPSPSFPENKALNCSNKSASSNSGSPSPRPGIKKRPAPAPPQAIRRTVCGSLESIQFDLNGIGDRLAVIQERVDQLEAAFHREKETAAAASAGPNPLVRDQKSMISEYLELVRETCTLARRQEELMYQRTEHKLEQEHADLEFNIRKIDLIPKFKRTAEDEKRSKDMITRLVDVIDQRNDVVENMTKINKRPDFDKRVERLRKMCKSESELDAVLTAFLLANDMDVIVTEMTSLSISNSVGASVGSKNGKGRDQQSKSKNKSKDQKKDKGKSATLRLPHFKSKEKNSSLGDPLPASNKNKSSTLKTIKKLGSGLKVKSPNNYSSSSSKSSPATGSQPVK